MTPEELRLLYKDLCGRLPYYVKIKDNNSAYYGEVVRISRRWHDEVNQIEDVTDEPFVYFVSEIKMPRGPWFRINYVRDVKPYLRPMSSMTEKETEEYCDLQDRFLCSNQYPVTDAYEIFDWLNAHHFDFRNLIEKGLALEAPEGMYKTE